MNVNYLLIAAGLCIPVFAFLWHFWESNIRSMFIPDAEIQKFATQLIEIYGDDAYDFVYMHERHCSEIYEQVKWRKVGKAIRQKQPHLYG